MPFKLDRFASWRLVAVVAFAAHIGSAPSLQAQDLSAPWPQTRSDLAAEPGVQFGTLPNGMRFAVMHNATPPGQASIRFRIGSGSLDESDDQQGLAHFLEHMAFKGSTHVAEGEIIRILQRKGLAFGPDTNAHTSYDETVYSLDLPEVDADTVSTGLMLMRETAGELTLDPQAFDRERGVILSEERQSDTPQYRAAVGVMDLLLAGQRVTLRSPIGKADIIKNAPVSLLRDYYRANYRPDKGTLMVVGDIDPATVAAEIRQRFGDWQASAPAPAAPDLGALKAKGESVDVMTVPGSMTSVQIAWTRPYEPAPDTAAKRKSQLIEDLGLLVLKRRMGTIASGADAPFISANAGADDLLKSAHVVLVTANAEPEKWQAALSAIDQEERRIQQFGISEAELKREILEYRSALQAEAAGAATRKTTDIAAMLAYSVNNDQVFTSPADDLSLFQAITDRVTVTEVNEALRHAFAGNGPQVLLQTAQAPAGGVDAVRQTFAASRDIAVSPLADAAAIAWPYTSFGEPGAVAERRDIDDLGVTMVRFENGTRLTVKPTKLRANEVLVREDIDGGRMDLPHDRSTLLWASPAVVLSGIKAMDYQDMQKALAAKIINIDFSVGDGSVKFDGQTRTEDLETQLQLMAAYTSDPAYRPEVFKRVQQAYLSGLDQYDATPGGIISRDFAGLVHSGDPRWTFPDRTELASATTEDFAALFHPLIARGAVEITIVGDVSVDDAIRLASATFGALPKRPEVTSPQNQGDPRFPAPGEKPVTKTHNGREDAAAAAVGIPVGDLLSDIPRGLAANVAIQIFENRLIDQFRIAEGATYSLQGAVDLSREIPGFGFAYFYGQTTPAKVERFYALVDKIAADMGSNAVSPDELARAREPIVETQKNQRQGNEYWVRSLQHAQTDPRRLDLIRSGPSGYAQVTSEDIRKFASTYLHAGEFWKLQVLPAAVR